MDQLLRVPNLESQRAAIKKLNFLVGEWVGEARVLRGPGEPTALVQTEEAQYKLDGLILTIEGVGRTKSDGKPILQALGIISYDDESKTYHMRAFNNGRFLETEVKLPEDGEGMTWGFILEEIRTKSVMRINDKGEWTEVHEISIGSQPPKNSWNSSSADRNSYLSTSFTKRPTRARWRGFSKPPPKSTPRSLTQALSATNASQPKLAEWAT